MGQGSGLSGGRSLCSTGRMSPARALSHPRVRPPRCPSPGCAAIYYGLARSAGRGRGGGQAIRSKVLPRGSKHPPPPHRGPARGRHARGAQRGREGLTEKVVAPAEGCTRVPGGEVRPGLTLVWKMRNATQLERNPDDRGERRSPSTSLAVLSANPALTLQWTSPPGPRRLHLGLSPSSRGPRTSCWGPYSELPDLESPSSPFSSCSHSCLFSGSSCSFSLPATCDQFPPLKIPRGFHFLTGGYLM